MNLPLATASTAANSGESAHRAVAPAWHTVVVLIVLFGSSVAGALFGGLTPGSGHYGRAPGYLLIIFFEWLTVAFIWWGVGRRGISMSELVGGSWPRPMAVLRDLGFAIGLMMSGALVLNGLGHLLKVAPNQAVKNLLPVTRTEIALYLLLSLTAGFCEELIFRGYLQRQFAALTQATTGGIILQGIAFGLGHGYQGWKMMLLISVFGAMFGVLAQWRRSLRPGMLAHALQDGIGGLVARHFMR